MSKDEHPVRKPSPLEVPLRLQTRYEMLERMAARRREAMERDLKSENANASSAETAQDKPPKRVQFADQHQEPAVTLTPAMDSVQEQRREREMAFEMEEMARKARMRETRKIMREALAKLPRKAKPSSDG